MSLEGLEIRSEKIVVAGNYRGLVVDNNDPRQLGRVKVEVYPFFADIVVANLPWAVPAMPLMEGAGDGFGSFVVPKVGTFVFVFFEAGDIYQPVYFAEAPTTGYGLPANRTVSYPSSKGFKTEHGIEFWIDDALRTIKVIHPTGTTIVVDTNGRITATSVEDISMIATRDIRITAGRDIVAHAARNLSITADVDVTADLIGDVTATFHGNVTETILGSRDESVTGTKTVNTGNLNINP